MNCPISVVVVGSTSVAQARNSSIWSGHSRPLPPLQMEQDDRLDAAFLEFLEPGTHGRIIEEQRFGDLGVGPPLVEQKDGVRPAHDAMLLQPVLHDLHQVGPVRCTEEITVRLHQATGIDTAQFGQTIFRMSKESRYSSRRPNGGSGLDSGVEGRQCSCSDFVGDRPATIGIGAKVASGSSSSRSPRTSSRCGNRPEAVRLSRHPRPQGPVRRAWASRPDVLF